MGEDVPIERGSALMCRVRNDFASLIAMLADMEIPSR